MAAPKGTKPPGGSRKGSPNKTTVELRGMIESALNKAGGAEYLARQAEENPPAFMSLVGKLIPKDVTVSGGVDVKVAASEAVTLMMRTLFKPPGKEASE